MIGRTHGIHAEPTTFGAKVALWALQLDRDRTRLEAAAAAVSVCKLSGAVGTYSNIDPAVERFVGDALGLTPVPATQVIARDRHAELLWACASTAATCEAIAVELRHLQRTEVAEVREGFTPGQKGSSAMPHKRNPIAAETVSGLARVVRSNLLAGLQDVALWHERDISHSSVERIVLPDSTLLVHYMLHRLNRLLQGLVVDAHACATTCGRATVWCSVSRCCSHSWRRARPVTTPIASCSATPCNRGKSGATSGRYWNLIPTSASTPRRSTRRSTSTAPSATRAACSRPSIRWSERQAERPMPARLSTGAGTPTSRHAL